MTRAMRLVLQAFLADPSRAMHGLEVARSADLASGTIHPVLARLEACGWLESRWEVLGQDAAGRPRRRFYRITPDGVVGAARALGRSSGRAAVRVAQPGLLPDLAEGTT